MTADLANGNITSAEYIATDIYVGTNLLRIPKIGPLLAGIYAIGGGSKSIVQVAEAVNLSAGIKAVNNSTLLLTCALQKQGAGATFTH
jgi:hypothetical protein